MKHQAFGATDVGRMRDSNEDAFLIDDELGVYVVCDGLGGHSAGEVAAQKTTEIVHRVLCENYKTLRTYAKQPTFYNRARAVTVVEMAVETACREIYWMGQADPERRGMASTLVMMVVVDTAAVLAHVGDSRVYVYRQGQIHKLTEDHVRPREGGPNPEVDDEVLEAAKSPLLTRAIGRQEHVKVDTLHLELMPGDLFLLCSDGASDYLAPRADEVLAILKEDKAQSLPEQFISLANDAGGKDNITVVALQIGHDGSEKAKEVARKVDILRRIPLFSTLSYQELVKVLNLVRVKDYAPGDFIIKEGEQGEELYISLAGTVEIAKQGEVLTELGRGSFFGEMGLIDNAPRSADVIAKDGSRLMIIRRNDFYMLLKTEPSLAVKLLWGFLQVLNGRLRETSAELSVFKHEKHDDDMLPDKGKPMPMDLSEILLEDDDDDDDGF